MKRIGMIGGMSWESTLLYYRSANEIVQKKLGGLHSLPCILSSVDFQQISDWQHHGAWDEAGAFLAAEAKKLEVAGAEAIILCTNTMHCVAPLIEQTISVPLLHIADAASVHIKKHGLNKVAVLGTTFTMEESFYHERLNAQGIDTLIPEAPARKRIHSMIFDELCVGITDKSSRDYLLEIIDSLQKEGAQGIVLGCTELPMIIRQSDVLIPVFDTARIHAGEAVRFALNA